ncbi:MAG: HDOD domain-containing protein [Myxococcales bacterium]|nr:HDOD domain-containing protein [Myxococcales bacterium]
MALEQRLVDLFESPTYRPPLLPDVALELMSLSRRAGFTVRPFLRTLEKDPILTATTMRIAGSAAYSRGQPPKNLREALVRLGEKTLGQIVLVAAMSQRVFRAPGYEAPMTLLRQHSVATAQAARVFADAAKKDGDTAFLAGLLHDAGIAAALIALTDRVRHPPAFELVWPVVDGMHARLTARVATLWNLPGDVRASVARPDQPPAGLEWLVASIAMGEHLAQEVSAPGIPSTELIPSRDVLAARLGLDEGALTLAWDRARVAAVDALVN